MSERLSIIIPSYQHRSFVAECIDAAARVEVEEKEIIVIDDGSSDGSEIVIRRSLTDVSKSVETKFIARANRGLVATLNEGLEAARGRYIYVVASDDVPNGRGVSKLVQRLDADDQLKFAMGNARGFDGQGAVQKPIYGRRHGEFFRVCKSDMREALFCDYPNFLVQASVFRADVLRDISGWDEDLVLDDYPLFIRLLQKFPLEGKQFVYAPDIDVVRYRIHGSNSYRNVRRQAWMVAQTLKKYCPEELMPRALARRYAHYALAALKSGSVLQATTLLRESSDEGGVYQTAVAGVREVRMLLTRKLSRDRC